MPTMLSTFELGHEISVTVASSASVHTPSATASAKWLESQLRKFASGKFASLKATSACVGNAAANDSTSVSIAIFMRCFSIFHYLFLPLVSLKRH